MKSFLYKSFACVILAFTSLPVIAFSQDTKTHVSSDKAFSITYPENWKVNKDRHFEFSIYQPGTGLISPSMVNIEINKKAEGYENADIHQIADAELQMMKTDQNTNIEILDSKFQEQNGHEWWIIHGKLTALGKEYLTETYKTIHNDKVYVFSYSSNEKNYEKNKDAADKIIASVNFLTEENNTSNNKTAVAENNNNSLQYYIEINVDEIDDFKDGFALARKGSDYFFYRPNGKLLEESDLYDYHMKPTQKKSALMQIDNSCGFFNGITIIKDKRSGKYGYMDTTGKVIVPCFLSEASHFEEDGYAFAKVSDNEHVKYYEFYFDKNGNRFQVPKGAEKGAYFLLFDKPKGTEVYRKNGTKAFESNLQFRNNNYSDGYFQITDFNTRKVGFADTMGKIKIPITLDDRSRIDGFSEGFTLIEPATPADYKYGFMNKAGNIVIKINEDENFKVSQRLKPFKYGYADCKILNKADNEIDMVLIDKDGRQINIQDAFKKSNPEYMNSIAHDDMWGKNYSITYKGRDAEGIYLDCVFGFEPDAKILKLYAKKKSGLGVGGVQSPGKKAKGYTQVGGIGMIDYTGKIIIPPVFSFIGEFDPVSGLAKAILYTSDKEFIQGFINRKGEFVIIQKTYIKNF